MNKKIILMGGYCATGKTTFAKLLSQKFSVPYFSKDFTKIALNRSISVKNRDDSKKLSAAAFDAMAYTGERLMEVGLPLIMEANFVMHPNHGGIKEGEALQRLIEAYSYTSFTYIFVGDTTCLYKRHAARDTLPERGVANKMWGEYTIENYIKDNLHLADFNVGGTGDIVRVDTTDFASVDYEGLTKIAHEFLIS